ncbi:HNH endonuclease [Schaedlerella arabinosiphila]|uniref:HNH endonuclease n=1 Tax=Schaedlerella arabinosiphila TaxID=2044587 RepID=A0A9X5CAR8_9FIRM|nr:HNH endonuclease [Schaedlerella arabinosiphila]KAI4442179.1 hypothetical protein C824_004689 [Schaedlerella arabinosiphila]NDO71224.1 HNH endonuclease [Schaedlerella arabinosiphila]
MSERRKFTAYEKETVYERYNGHCAICGRPVSPKRMTISHKTPLSKGGTNGMDNLLLSCWSCSQAKQNLSMEEFYQKIGELFFYNADEIAKHSGIEPERSV